MSVISMKFVLGPEPFWLKGAIQKQSFSEVNVNSLEYSMPLKLNLDSIKVNGQTEVEPSEASMGPTYCVRMYFLVWEMKCSDCLWRPCDIFISFLSPLSWNSRFCPEEKTKCSKPWEFLAHPWLIWFPVFHLELMSAGVAATQFSVIMEG